jgi:phosphoglycolate phosphatase-like HAD superfamily hydrolase
MRADGVPDAVIDVRMEPLLARYVMQLSLELADPAHPPRLHPGVEDLLDALERLPGITLGLLTGNLEAGARAKLQAVGIDPARFRVGAFGSDHADRPELPAIALQRLRDVTGAAAAGDALVVIGDTPNDITCGRAVGARAIGVATGRFSVTDLEGHGATAIFADLSDTDAVVAHILTS